MYVRGEENLRGWRPRRGSLIIDHREQVNKLHMIEEVWRERRLARTYGGRGGKQGCMGGEEASKDVQGKRRLARTYRERRLL